LRAVESAAQYVAYGLLRRDVLPAVGERSGQSEARVRVGWRGRNGLLKRRYGTRMVRHGQQRLGTQHQQCRGLPDRADEIIDQLAGIAGTMLGKQRLGEIGRSRNVSGFKGKRLAQAGLGLRKATLGPQDFAQQRE